MRIVFAGTPDFAQSHLAALLKAKHNIVAVYTQPDRPAGRGKKLNASPVKKLALEKDIPVFQPENFKLEEDIQQLRDLKPDLFIVVAYGLLLPQAVLDIPTKACINSHASLLPRWRGAAPIQRAIESGDAASGVTVMQMELGLDTGPMLHKLETPINSDDTGGTLHDRLAVIGSQAILEVVAKYAAGPVFGEVQDDSLSCYARKLSKKEALIDWKIPATQVVQKIRAFNPFPTCYTFLGNDRIKVLSAQVNPMSHQTLPGTIIAVNETGVTIACQQHAVTLKQVQLPNKKPMMVCDLLNGNHPFQENHVLASEL